MFITVDDVHKVVNDYLVREIVPKIKSDAVKFGLSFCAGYLGDKAIGTFMVKYGSILNAMGIIEDGKIDINVMKENALRALKACPDQKFEYMGYVADEDDIDALYKIMLQYAQSHSEKVTD